MGWLRVERVLEANRDTDESEPTPPARVLAQDSITSDLAEVDVEIHFSYWPGIDWALASDGEVWLALGDSAAFRNTTGNPVIYTVVFTSDGRAFFPGSCQHEALYDPLQSKFTDSFDNTMRSIVGQTGDELATLVKGPTQPEPQQPDVTILNPSDVPDGFLDSFNVATLHISLSEPLGSDFTICTHVPAGWNECFVPDDMSVAIGYAIIAYYEDGDTIEVWLLDKNANVLEPLQLLGEVEVPGNLSALCDVALRIEIDTSRVDEKEPSLVELVEAIDGKDLNRDRAADWPALYGPTEP